MKAALAALFLVAVPLAHAGTPAAAALDKLEKARANLTKAVQAIEKDPPATADLDAALTAVNGLKDAIEAGAAFEANDLEFAKSVLGARKELRTQREYVEGRRANMDIHNARRTIDEALKAVGGHAKAIEGKDPSPTDFDEAHTAVSALRKTVDDARPLAKRDPKFATYLTEVDASLGKTGKAIDDKWVALSADKHRGLVEEARKQLTAAMTPLSKNATDEEFKEADRALSLLNRLVDEGKPIEPKNAQYKIDAEKARKELVTAKQKMDTLWTETGLARLKAEVEPARKDLATAGKAVRQRKPTEDQLAEAKTAIIVVKKLIEKFEAEAKRSTAIGQYMDTVKATLAEVEVELQRRALDAAKADVNATLKKVLGKAPTDEDFTTANSAVGVLEKTLETVNAKDPAMEPHIFDAKALIKDTRATLLARRTEVDVLRQKAKVEEARKKAAEMLKTISQPNIAKELIGETESSIKTISTVLDEGAALVKKDREYAAYDKEVRERIKELNEKLASRKVIISAVDARAVLGDMTTAAKTAIDAAKQVEATEADITAAAKAVETLGQTIEKNLPLEKQDQGYAVKAEKTKEAFYGFQEGLEIARASVELRKQTITPLAAGQTSADSGAVSKNLRLQKDEYEKAIVQFKTCQETGGALLRENPVLAGVVMFLDGKKTPPKDVIALCSKKLTETQAALAQVKPLIAFDEGPKKSFELGKGLLAQKKDAEALKHFSECISSGGILQNRNPELKERKFEVAGSETSLPELIQACIAQRKALLVKK